MHRHVGAEVLDDPLRHLVELGVRVVVAGNEQVGQFDVHTGCGELPDRRQNRLQPRLAHLAVEPVVHGFQIDVGGVEQGQQFQPGLAVEKAVGHDDILQPLPVGQPGRHQQQADQDDPRFDQQQQESGQYAGLEDLAVAAGVDRTYVGRILRLTSLAPEIVERILTGDEPEGISLRRLQKDLPVVWEEQEWG